MFLVVHKRFASDIDECEAIPGLCEGGKCINSEGSFSCECPEGQTRNLVSNACEDRDECAEDGVCENGRCVNTDGGYRCICNRGFIPSPQRKSCIGRSFIGIKINIITCSIEHKV